LENGTLLIDTGELKNAYFDIIPAHRIESVGKCKGV
jgi:hypothetical protein